MKKISVSTWIGICIATPVVGYILYIALSMAVTIFITQPMREARARQQILNTDPGALLIACRNVITNWNEIKVEASNNPHAEFIFSDRIAFRDGNYGRYIPEIIREMNPRWIDARSNRVEVRVQYMRVGIIGYIEGGERYDVMDWSKCTMLTNGLWFYDH